MTKKLSRIQTNLHWRLLRKTRRLAWSEIALLPSPWSMTQLIVFKRQHHQPFAKRDHPEC